MCQMLPPVGSILFSQFIVTAQKHHIFRVFMLRGIGKIIGARHHQRIARAAIKARAMPSCVKEKACTSTCRCACSMLSTIIPATSSYGVKTALTCAVVVCSRGSAPAAATACAKAKQARKISICFMGR